RFTTGGLAIGAAVPGINEATSTTLPLGNFTAPINLGTSTTRFNLGWVDNSTGEANDVEVEFVSPSVDLSVEDLVGLINSAIESAEEPLNPISVRAVLTEDKLGIEFQDMIEGA